ncbi:ESCRT-0 subunit protein hse1 [Actinomortierella ambigua]|uniref:Class E vacuolar protein-sorting machinery protein HSE1 n=1 Tax=Actinomortierella ambigua TaxID=1343610 RepID=A0A9P6QKR1_9FUNG|nr:ESCRT-0 subunit protein hse1 [Actinomortierella ambigua]
MFRGQNPFDEVIEKATSETLTSENWDLILTISLQKRMGANKNTNVTLYSLSLCESLSKNCGVKIQRELASRSFTQLLVKILNEKTTHPAVRQRILELIQQWAYEFRNDPSLGIMDETFQQLRTQGKFKFPSPQKPKKELKSETEKRKEEEELQLALALSLSASEHKSQLERQASMKAQRQATESAAAAAAAALPKKRVRALYDFEPSESGELGFQKGDIITVLATSYQDWWKGELYGREGIFPVNYIEEIKDVNPAEAAEDEAHVLQETRNLDGLLQMLSNVDPRRDNFSENDTLQDHYNNALGVRPKVVEYIKKYGEKKDDLISLSEKLARARATYERMMEQSIAKYSNPGYQTNYPPYGGHQPQQQHPQAPPMGGYYGQPPAPQGFVSGPPPFSQPAQPYQTNAPMATPQLQAQPLPQQLPQPQQSIPPIQSQLPQQQQPPYQPQQPLLQGSAPPPGSQFAATPQPQFQPMPQQGVVPQGQMPPPSFQPQQQQQQQQQPLPQPQQPFDQAYGMAPPMPSSQAPPIQDFSSSVPVSMQGSIPPQTTAPMPSAGYQPAVQQQLPPQPQGQMYAY